MLLTRAPGSMPTLVIAPLQDLLSLDTSLRHVPTTGLLAFLHTLCDFLTQDISYRCITPLRYFLSPLHETLPLKSIPLR